MEKLKALLDNDLLKLIARVVLGFMFLVVAVGKIYDAGAFAKEITRYSMAPELIVNFMAIVMPWLELATGLLIIAGIRVKANAALIGAMLIMFIAAVATAWARGLNINCGCYSNLAKEVVGIKKILENSSLLILAVYLFYFPKGKLSLENFIANKD